MEGPPDRSSIDAIFAYADKVNAQFLANKFPDLSHVKGGSVIQGCWDNRFQTAEDVLYAVRSEML
jgi:hypothetical protein